MEKNSSLVSILIPVYNSEKFLRKALQSVADQTYSNVEIVIVDDCSKDSSRKIVTTFFEEYEHIQHKVINNKINQGVSFGRNTLVDNASGEFICFLDSDDYLEPDFVSYLLGVLTKNNSSMGQCLYFSEEPSGVSVGKTNDFASDTTLQGKNAVFSMLEGKVTGYLWHKIFKRDLFDGIRFDTTLTVFEDYEVIMKMFVNGASIAFGNERKYHYIQHASSLTKQSYLKILNRLEYLNRTKSLVSPLIISETDKEKWAKHSYLVILMVFINAVRYGAPLKDVIGIRRSIDLSYVAKLSKSVSLKKLSAISLIKVSPYLFYFMLKTAFKIKA